MTVGELLAVISIQSIVTTVRAVRTNFAVHPFTTERAS